MMLSVVAAQKTHTRQIVQSFQSGKTSSVPGTCVPPASEGLSAHMALAIMYEGHACHSGTASEESASKTDEKPTRESVGLMGQVASCRPFHPPLAMNLPRDLDGSRAVYPISRTSVKRWAALSSLRPLGNLVKSDLTLLCTDA
jgi:hypothetical protein